MMRPLLFLCILGSHFASAFSSPATFSFMGPSVVMVTPQRQPQHEPLLPKISALYAALSSRGGALNQAQASTETGKCPFTKFTKLASSLYGTGGVLYILSKAIRRVAPIALEPFTEGAIPLTQLQLGYVSIQIKAVICCPCSFLLHHVIRDAQCVCPHVSLVRIR